MRREEDVDHLAVDGEVGFVGGLHVQRINLLKMFSKTFYKPGKLIF